MNFWNGAFGFRKSIGTVSFIPLHAMTSDDWDVLDWEALRPRAKNRIARLIVTGALLGFIQVNILEKKAKSRYYWPADEETVGELEDDSLDFFRNEADDEFDSTDAENVEGLISDLRTSSPAALEALANRLSTRIELPESKQQLRDLAEDLSGKTLTPPGIETFLLLAIYAYRVLGLQDTLDLLDELEESNA